jgi:hypothetical protein
MEPEDSLSLKSPGANSRVNVELMSEISETQSPSSEVYVSSDLLAVYIYRKKNYRRAEFSRRIHCIL